MRDILIIIVLLLSFVVGFYAFKILVLLLVGFVIYLCMPLIKALLNIREG